VEQLVTSAIVGARRPEQVAANVGGAGWQLSAEDLGQIEQAYAETIAA
jgi:aryl-alcohol dehydrogenase-like predicted oxidoreductase